ncbi:hypothetical protein ILYODFUR_027598 [Ilyodon furcidens]|uniref:Uncharacterized protein n=1 Tax=Ilyodon furcidens TaxID=33524 RepID=A0ABV0SR34_9TELE
MSLQQSRSASPYLSVLVCNSLIVKSCSPCGSSFQNQTCSNSDMLRFFWWRTGGANLHSQITARMFM